MEAIRLLNDWSKWIVTLETAAIAGIFAWLRPNSAERLRSWELIPNLALVLAAVCFAISIYYAAQLFFSLPDIVEQLPDAEERSINDMTGNYMGAGILEYEKRQWYLFVGGLALVIAGALAMLVVSLLAPRSIPKKSSTVESSAHTWGEETSTVFFKHPDRAQRLLAEGDSSHRCRFSPSELSTAYVLSQLRLVRHRDGGDASGRDETMNEGDDRRVRGRKALTSIFGVAPLLRGHRENPCQKNKKLRPCSARDEAEVAGGF